MVKEANQPFYLLLAEERIFGFNPFSKGLRAMQTASFRIWTQVTMSISNNDDHYDTCLRVKILGRFFDPPVRYK